MDVPTTAMFIFIDRRNELLKEKSWDEAMKVLAVEYPDFFKSLHNEFAGYNFEPKSATEKRIEHSKLA